MNSPQTARSRSRRICRRAGAAAAARILALAALMAITSAGGCAHPREPIRLDSPDVNVRIAAIRRAARTKDKSAAPQLVVALDDEDPAVRFYAIEALRRLTGERKGYDYFEDDPDLRRPAVQRWRQWVVEQGMTMPESSVPPATRPAAAAATGK